MRWLLLIFGLTGCDMAGRDFRGVAPTRVSLGGMEFVVRVKDTKAEAIRMTPMARPRMDRVGVLAGLAIEGVSGCRVRRIGGDVAVVTAQLRCGQSSASAPVPAELRYSCDLDTVEVIDGDGWADLSCQLVPG